MPTESCVPARSAHMGELSRTHLNTNLITTKSYLFKNKSCIGISCDGNDRTVLVEYKSGLDLLKRVAYRLSFILIRVISNARRLMLSERWGFTDWHFNHIDIYFQTTKIYLGRNQAIKNFNTYFLWKHSISPIFGTSLQKPLCFGASQLNGISSCWIRLILKL